MSWGGSRSSGPSAGRQSQLEECCAEALSSVVDRQDTGSFWIILSFGGLQVPRA